MIKHLCSVKLRHCSLLEIACHPEATHFICESGKIRFYRVNPKPSEKMHEIPRGTNTIQFDTYTEHRGWINYGDIEFKSHKGNILIAKRYSESS